VPSVSKAQQRFMGLVHAYKKGEVPASQVSQAVKDAAKSMKKKSTKKMASTKHKGLPNKVRSENMNEDVFAIVDKYDDRKQDYDQVYFKDNNLNKVKKQMKKMGKKYGKMNLIRVKSNGKMSVVENLKEDGHTDVASAERKLKLIIKDAMDTLNALRSLSNEDSLPSWWTDKITLAKDYVGKSRDYIMNPAESVNEDITSAGYYFLRKAAYSITVALKDLNKGIKKQEDNRVLPEIEYIYDKATEMKKMLKNKRYNESINENFYVLSQKKGTTNKPEAEEFKSKILALRYAKSLEKTHVIMFLDKQSNMKNIKVKSESVNEGKGVEKVLKMADEKSFGKIAGRTVDGMTAGLFKAVYDKAPQNSKDKIDKMSEKQLYVFMGKLWNKFGRQVKLS